MTCDRSLEYWFGCDYHINGRCFEAFRSVFVCIKNIFFSFTVVFQYLLDSLLVSLWWRGDSLVLCFFLSIRCWILYMAVSLFFLRPTLYYKHTHSWTVSKSRYSLRAWEPLDRFLDHFGVCVYCCAHACNLSYCYSLWRHVLQLNHSVCHIWHSFKCDT